MIPAISWAQIDTAFWMALPDIYSNPNSSISHIKLSSTIPGDGNYYYQSFFTDGKGKVKTFPKNWGAMGSAGIQYGWNHLNIKSTYKTATDFSRMAVKFTTSKLSTCFYETTHPTSSDLYSMKGFNGLGTTFVAPFQNRWENEVGGGGSTLDIVATENNTAVIITPSNNLKDGQPAGKPFAVSMTRGQYYRVAAASYLKNQRLNGTIIKSNKPIAVTMNDFEVKYDNNRTDLNGDQLVPVEVLGSEYILVKGRYQDVNALGNITNLDRYFVTAVYDNTQITIGGNLVATLNAGQSYDRAFANGVNAEYMTSSNPVYVYQISSMGNQPGGALVPSINCNGNKSIFTFLPTHYFVYEQDILNNPNHDFYKTKTGVILFTKKGGEKEFNKTAEFPSFPFQFPIVETDFADVPATGGEWKYAFYDITPYTYTTSLYSDWLKSKLRYVEDKLHVFFKTNINNSQNFHAALVSSSPETGKLAYFTNFIDLKLPDTANVGCRGDSVYLFAGTGASDYQWYFRESGGVIKNSISKRHFIYAKKPGMYYIEKQTESCNARDSVWVKFEPPVKPNIGKDTTICADTYTPMLLDASNSKYIYYRWNDDIDKKLPTLTAQTPEIYIVETIDANFCMVSDTIEIKYGKKITTNNFQKNFTTCLGDTFRIGPDLNSSYTYRWNIAKGLLNQNVNRPLYTAHPNDSNYVLSISEANNLCQKKDTIKIKTFLLPIFNLGNDTTFCAANPFTITLNPLYNYQWKPSLLFSNPQSKSQTIAAGTKETITVTSSYLGCKYDDTLFVNSGKPLLVNPYTTIYNLCENDSILMGPETNIIYKYEWTPSLAFKSPNSAKSWFKNIYPSNTTQFFTLKITEPDNPCKKEDNIQIKILEAPQPQYAGDTSLCKGDSLLYILNRDYTYLWQNNLLINDVNSGFQNIKPFADATISFTSFLNSCKNNEKINIRILARPLVNITGKDSVCEGEQILLQASGAKAYSWNDSPIDAQDFFTDLPLQTTIYKLLGYNDNGCASMAKHQTFVWSKLPLQFKSHLLEVCLDNDSINLDTFIVTNSNNYKITFQNKSLTLATIKEYGMYFISIRNTNCETRDSLLIKSNCNSGIFVPKSFSPNDDGLNDKFEIFTNQTEVTEILIFNRWGEIVFQSDSQNKLWDGNYLDKKAISGIYPWIIKYKNLQGTIKSITGSINLIR